MELEDILTGELNVAKWRDVQGYLHSGKATLNDLKLAVDFFEKSGWFFEAAGFAFKGIEFVKISEKAKQAMLSEAIELYKKAIEKARKENDIGFVAEIAELLAREVLKERAEINKMVNLAIKKYMQLERLYDVDRVATIFGLKNIRKEVKGKYHEIFKKIKDKTQIGFSDTKPNKLQVGDVYLEAIPVPKSDCFDVGIRIAYNKNDLFVPFSHLKIVITKDDKIIREGITDVEGLVFFEKLPKGKYKAEIIRYTS